MLLMPRQKQSIPFNEHQISTQPAVDSLINRLQTEVFDFLKLERVNREKYRYVIQVVVLNLFTALQIDDTSVAIPLTAEHWTKNKRAGSNPKISYTRLSNTWKALTDKDRDGNKGLGYLTLSTPHFYGDIAGEVATYKATRKLRKLFKDYEIRLASLEVDFETFQVVRMRDVKPERTKGQKKRPKGKLLPIGDSPPQQVWQWIEEVKEINYHYRMNHIDLYVTDEEFTAVKRSMSHKSKRLEEEEQFRQVQFHMKFAYRVFNNRKWDNGGRFYGVWWQSIPSGWRHRITINNHITTEKDYTAIHFYILYNEAKAEYPERLVDQGFFDPYDLKGYNEQWKNQDTQFIRKTTKLAMNIALNADTQLSAEQACRERLKGRLPEGYTNWRQFINHIREIHKDIDFAFCSGKGIYYQYLDSKVANRVIQIMLKQHGTPVLPVHDSFLCRVIDEDKLERAMVQACNEELGISIPMTIASEPKPIKQDDGTKHPTAHRQVKEVNPELCSLYFGRLQQFSDSYPADIPIIPPDFEQPLNKMKQDKSGVDSFYLNEEQIKERQRTLKQSQ